MLLEPSDACRREDLGANHVRAERRRHRAIREARTRHRPIRHRGIPILHGSHWILDEQPDVAASDLIGVRRADRQTAVAVSGWLPVWWQFFAFDGFVDPWLAERAGARPTALK